MSESFRVIPEHIGRTMPTAAKAQFPSQPQHSILHNRLCGLLEVVLLLAQVSLNLALAEELEVFF